MKYETKGNHSRQGSCLLNITYYKLRVGKHFAYYIIGQGVEGYRVGDAREILNQTLMHPREHECLVQDFSSAANSVAFNTLADDIVSKVFFGP